MMHEQNEKEFHRILVIDDSDSIHNDFRKTLICDQPGSPTLASAKAALFGGAEATPTKASGSRFELVSASQGEEGLLKLEVALQSGKPFSVAFVDMRMPPGWDGVQTIQHLWEKDPKLQVVICTAYADYSWEEITAKFGMSDQLLILKKPFDPAEVRQMAAALTESWELRRKAELKLEEMEKIIHERTSQLAQAALHDDLTGLPNRSLFIDRLTQTIRRRKREPEHNFALFFIDFDRFKLVNDSLGHEVGDELLSAIAARLLDSMRESDTVAGAGIGAERSTTARLGGDEFVILADGIRTARDAGSIAERLLTAMGKPFEVKGHRLCSSASIGVTTADIGYDRPEDMLRDADAAMYSAKSAGKANYVLFDQAMHTQVSARLELEQDLRQALELKQLLLHYQPIVSITTGKLEGFEALLRWKSPKRGLVAPDVFIPCCEETGMIVPIGLWVLTEACRQLTQWQKQFPPFSNLRMSINLSARQLSVPNFADQVKQILQQTGVDPQAISLEITESMMVKNTQAVLGTLQSLRGLGIKLELDDFGMGYSSLSFLHQLPLSGIKIDRSFVKGISERRDYAAVIQAIITLARNLGLSLVAEGIESKDQLVMLQSMDCDKAQGFYFSKPMPAEQAETYIRQMAAKKFEPIAA
jgi:diguanylate cyclase